MSQAMTMGSTRFVLPDELQAREPPEARGLRRDGVRLLVAASAGLRHLPFVDLPSVLAPGDLVVVNTSATLPAAVSGTRGTAGPVAVHFSSPTTPCVWLVELRPPVHATGPVTDAQVGERIDLPDGVQLTLLAPHTRTGDGHVRLWRASVAVEGDVTQYLQRVGKPISYGYVSRSWPLRYYQTVFAREPGSAEMPSAGRPFTTDLVTALVAGGVVIAPISLHTGVSSLEAGEPPVAERYLVPPATARLVNVTRRSGGRVIAVGTTVTRALETVADEEGQVNAGAGWTDLVLGPHRPARVVDGLVTGWHAPGASHLLLLEAVAGAERVAAAYREALRTGYLWHEFGDSALLFADRG
jgi:S-adenosylmethionine:tRNA ribosyltransferase-isomerase